MRARPPARASRSARGGTRRTARQACAQPFWGARSTAAGARAGSSRWTVFACRPEQERRQLGAHREQMERVLHAKTHTFCSLVGAICRRRTRGILFARKLPLESVQNVLTDKQQTVGQDPALCARPDARSAVIAAALRHALRASRGTTSLEPLV